MQYRDIARLTLEHKALSCRRISYAPSQEPGRDGKPGQRVDGYLFIFGVFPGIGTSLSGANAASRPADYTIIDKINEGYSGES